MTNHHDKQRSLSFGRTGLKVSAIGFGAGHIGDPDQIDEREANKLLNEVLDAGVTLIDTARGYGLSEERIGKYISARRDEYVLSTKVGYGIEGYEDWTYDCIIAGVDHALRLLKTDVLDIVHLHSCPLETLRQGEVIEALHKAVEAGKVRVAAYSGENEDLDFAIATGAFSSLQFSVNLFDQRSIDRQLSEADRQQLGVIAKRPIANAPWRFEEHPVGLYCEAYWLRMKQMGIEPGDMSWNEMAIRFSAFQTGVSSCILGTSNISHLREQLRYIDHGPLPEQVETEIREAFRRHDQNWIGQI
ncbi:MAG: aldo/keto reductase [Candidatus Cohnella colombiensis]|uniref:Aldo/keto reductase n=1 Tax=Candidatus Cohnella colombiensis TaxID=3121368 RepID=A0AA95EWH2_9BACL|nr:MAG: aldo/keto reductase [Cohnella sp.]